MKPQRANRPQDSRRPYRAPTVRSLGMIRDLTRGGATSDTSDHGNNSMSIFP